MKTFTYSDYIKCIHTLRLNAVFQFAEEESQYMPDQDYIQNKIRGVVKDIFNEEEMAKFINHFLKPKEKIKSKNLIKYKIKYSAIKYKSQIPELLYKLQNKEVYFLVKQTSILDSKVFYKVLNYCIDIMYDWNKTKKIEKGVFYPIIVPIIIYIGGEKRNFLNNQNKKTISSYVFENYEIDLKYNLIDISKLTNNYLMHLNSLFGYAMIIAKSNDKEELKENIKNLMQNINNEKYISNLRNILFKRFQDFLENKELKEIL